MPAEDIRHTEKQPKSSKGGRKKYKRHTTLDTPLDKLALPPPPTLVLQAGILQGSFYHLFITITPTVPPLVLPTYI